MRTRYWAPALLFAGAVGPGCTPHATFVKTDQAALGRVVVYRNGIAYYERRAHAEGDRLTLRVPGDKVDDFLKSLTVADARTGRALPVSYPSQLSGQQGESGHVDMAIQLPPGGPRDLLLSYVTDAPAWKPSYRVVVDKDGKVNLQGWAVVDNTSGEDWRSVRVGVGSSSALSFRYDLHSIRLVHRETLQSQDSFAKAPPLGGSIYRNTPEKQQVLGELADGDIPRQDGHPDSLADQGIVREHASAAKKSKGGRGGPASEASGAAAAPSAPYALPRDDSRMRALAQSLKNRRGPVLIEGYANAGESDDRALDRANLLRNQLILQGVAPAQLQVAARGVVAGQRARVRLVDAGPQGQQNAQNDAPKDGQKGPDGKDEGNPVGESHFESDAPMTVARGSSAMVPILTGRAQGEVVYLYDAESPSGDPRFAFRAVRFRNPTPSTLETGPMTVYGNGRFIGEGLTEAIPPGSLAVVPFALDRQIVVEREEDGGDRIAQLTKLVRGVLTAEVEHSRKTRLKVTNRLHTPATVLLRHTVPKGWRLEKSPKLAEQYGDARLFTAELGPGETRVLEIEEVTPMRRTLDLRSPVGIELTRVYLQTPGKDAAFAGAMAQMLKEHAEMVRCQEEIESLRQRGDEYRARLDELHQQILSLQLVKAGGSLMQHLQVKMKEISQRVQDNTIAIVDLKEKEMLARVRFQDGVSELVLGQPGARTADAR